MSDAGQIVKSGAFEKLADIVHKLAGPMAEEVGLMMADKIKVYRVKNWVGVVKKTQEILNDARLPPNAVPPRLLLPIIEASSVESDETLQDLWAGLLASASDKSDSLSPSFIEILKQLTPSEARLLNSLFEAASAHKIRRLGGLRAISQLAPERKASGAVQLCLDSFERLGLIRREYDLQEKTRNYGIFGDATPAPDSFFGHTTAADLPELTFEFEFTEYGLQFMRACKGPQKMKPKTAKKSS